MALEADYLFSTNFLKLILLFPLFLSLLSLSLPSFLIHGKMRRMLLDPRQYYLLVEWMDRDGEINSFFVLLNSTSLMFATVSSSLLLIKWYWIRHRSPFCMNWHLAHLANPFRNLNTRLKSQLHFLFWATMYKPSTICSYRISSMILHWISRLSVVHSVL